MNSQVQQRLRSIRQALNAGRPVCGFWLFLGSPIVTEIVATAGFDLVIIDMEHAPGSLETLYHMLRACDAQGVPAIVRLSEANAGVIQRVLDAGASGIAIAYVESATDVEALVQAATYAPTGKRGTHSAPRAASYGKDWSKYRKEVSDDVLLVALVESLAGIERLTSICEVSGLDAVMIGEGDLSASLGHHGQFERREFREVLTGVESEIKSGDRLLFGVAHSMEDAQDKILRGYTLLTYGGGDLVCLRDTVQSVVRDLNSIPGSDSDLAE